MKIHKSKLSPVISDKKEIIKVASRGIGDVVAKIIHPFIKGTKLEGCKSCKQRQEKLNTIIPFNT